MKLHTKLLALAIPQVIMAALLRSKQLPNPAPPSIPPWVQDELHQMNHATAPRSQQQVLVSTVPSYSAAAAPLLKRPALAGDSIALAAQRPQAAVVATSPAVVNAAVAAMEGQPVDPSQMITSVAAQAADDPVASQKAANIAATADADATSTAAPVTTAAVTTAAPTVASVTMPSSAAPAPAPASPAVVVAPVTSTPSPFAGPQFAPAPQPAAAAAGARCTPQCSWKCASQACDQVCKPKCAPPRCQTRCTGMSTVGCKMKCGEPNCAVVFPARSCATASCPIAKTQCSTPICSLVCPTGGQNCVDVCEEPSCSWDCNAPDVCPEPSCSMVCEPPTSCSLKTTYKELPAVKAGETIVENFVTPISLVQHTRGSIPTMSVPIIQATAVPGSNEVLLVHTTASLPIDK